MRPRICVVGSSNMDLIVRTARLPRPGETLAATSFTTCAGGKGGNQAVIAARLGAEVTMVGRIGRDAFGKELRRRYEDEGIDTTHLLYDDELPTGVATILVDHRGRNCILVAAGANGAVSPKDVRRARKAVVSADVLLCQHEIPAPATLEALRIANEERTQTILNPAPARPLATLTKESCPRIGYLVPNETELQQMTGSGSTSLASLEKAAKELRKASGGEVLVTLGVRGALVASGASTWREKTIAVDAVDTSGAGDAFVGAFATFLVRKLPLREAVRSAMGVAALTVTRSGTQSSYPTRREAFAFLRKHGLMIPG